MGPPPATTLTIPICPRGGTRTAATAAWPTNRPTKTRIGTVTEARTDRRTRIATSVRTAAPRTTTAPPAASAMDSSGPTTCPRTDCPIPTAASTAAIPRLRTSVKPTPASTWDAANR
uniref:(northern house mosquito) hypothetical protein n=1 Tax=Culex pipiens TaxID=7175 RepID=A0A8D8KJ09_CULPI